MLNEYIHKPSFMKGVKVGLAIKRKKRVIDIPVEPDIPDTPTQYLYGQVAPSTVSYNGVVLPDIEGVWTDELKQTYPYAVICQEEEQIIMFLSTATMFSDGSQLATQDGKLVAVLLDNGSWVIDGEEDTSHGNTIFSIEYSVWSSYDILNTDGSVYLAASDPVKSYPDATVIVDGVGYKGAILPALPEWDREQYPYAILLENVFDANGIVSRTVILHCFAENAYYFTSGNLLYFGGKSDGEQVARKVYNLTDDAWILKYDDDNGNVQVTTPEGYTAWSTTVTTFWANFKAEYDGTVYIDPIDPIPVGEIVGYSYNGVTLPALSESDLEYAVIIYSGLDVTYFLYMFDEQPIAHNVYYEYYDTTQLHIGRPEGCRVQFWGSSREGWDKQTKPTTDRDNDNGWAMANSDRVHWTSHDILNEDGTIYLSASEPVPVYEKE
jgi:hypothetical protein